MSSSNTDDQSNLMGEQQQQQQQVLQIAEEEARNKRSALAGQWRTPPTAFFGMVEETAPHNTTTNINIQPQIQVEAPMVMESILRKDDVTKSNSTTAATTEIASSLFPVPPTIPVTLPNTTEDYAKALHEAYLRGAEAASRAAANQSFIQQQPLAGLTPVLQCGGAINNIINNNNNNDNNSSPLNAILMPPPAPVVMQSFKPAPPSLVASMPIPSLPIPSAGVSVPTTTPATITTATTIAKSTAIPNNSTSVPNGTDTTAIAPTKATKQSKAHQQRSVSLPDMTSYATQREEEKRQKRLARNRASARLRRLRKKNLVDAYETEVGSLEKTLTMLQQHEWGTGDDDAAALAEALSMDRGQQLLSPEERQQAATDILSQQLQFIQQLEDLMQEQYVLYEIARLRVRTGGSEAEQQKLTEVEWDDLAEMLQLTDTQCQQLVHESTSWEDEWNALQTVKLSLQAMRDNHWLWNEGCTALTDQFLQILHKNQISKFLVWTDHNAEMIDELDSVHAKHTVADSPIFQFGIDSNPNELLEDEKAIP